MTDRDASVLRRALLAAIVGAIAFAAYLPALAAGFTSDDFLIVSLLQRTNGLDHIGPYFTLSFYDYYRPLVFLSHALDWQVWRMNAAGFHLTNLLLHAVNAVLVLMLARRLMPPVWALVAAMLFALHPPNHEAVYWIAARFDLMATAFSLLAILWLTGTTPQAYAAGLAAFALALLSKESAVTVPLVVAAHDVFVRTRSARSTVMRLLPMPAIMAGYALARSAAAGVPAMGGSARAGKLVLLAVAAGALIAMARRRSQPAPNARRPLTPATRLVLAAGVVLAAAAAAIVPASSAWMQEKLAFVSYATYHLLTPVAEPPLPPYGLVTVSDVYWIAGLVAAGLIVLALLAARRWLSQHGASAFLVAFLAAAILPVSTMTGGTRYLYLASVAASLLAAFLAASVAPTWRLISRIAIALSLVIAPLQIVRAGRAWIWASHMSQGAIAAIAPRLRPCGSVDLVLLTAPAGIRGVYSNLNDETFSTAGCPAASVRAVTRVLHYDVHVEITSATPEAIEWRIAGYRSNAVASEDLRAFRIPILAGGTAAIETPVGRLETSEQGGAQLFRLSLAKPRSARVFAAYTDGEIRVLPGTVQ